MSHSELRGRAVADDILGDVGTAAVELLKRTGLEVRGLNVVVIGLRKSSARRTW